MSVEADKLKMAGRSRILDRPPPPATSGAVEAALLPHRQPAIIAMRRVAALGGVAGYVVVFGAANIGGLYPAPMTGNTTQFAVSLAHLQWSHALLVGAMLGSFFCGGLLSSALRRYVVSPSGELLIMSGLLTVAQVVASFIVHPLAIELPILAFAMAMQGETASRFGGRAIQTIVITNTMLKCADGIIVVLHGRRDVDGASPGSRTEAWADVAVPASAWTGYFLARIIREG